jgi:anti-anti-sigma regulatory factor
MKYQITEQGNYTLIEILESQLSESHHSHFKKLFTEIQSKKISHVILDMNYMTRFDASGLPMLILGHNIFKELGSFILCKIPLELEKLIKTNSSARALDFVPTLEEAIESVMLTDLENMLKKEG